MVVGRAHRAVTLVVGHAGPVGAVDGDVQVVGAQSVPMSVRVGEEATLGVDRGRRDTQRRRSTRMILLTGGAFEGRIVCPLCRHIGCGKMISKQHLVRVRLEGVLIVLTF